MENQRETKTSIKGSAENSTGGGKKIKCCESKKIYIFFAFLLVFAAGLASGKYLAIKSGQNFSPSSDVFVSGGKTWVAYNDPIVNFTVINDKNCQACDASDIVSKIKSLMPTGVSREVDVSSPEAAGLLQKYRVKNLPAIVFDSSIEKTSFFSQLSQALDKQDDGYILNLVKIGLRPGKYLALPTVTDTDPQKGPAGAPVKIIEFSDFQCPYCKRAEAVVKQVETAYSGKISIVYKQFPLPFHENARPAAEASLCAKEQGKFWEMHDFLFANQDKLGSDDLKKYARQLKLDASKFNACLDGNKYNSQIDADIAEGTGFGISGTPAFFINNDFLGGAYPFEEFQKIMDSQLSAAQK